MSRPSARTNRTKRGARPQPRSVLRVPRFGLRLGSLIDWMEWTTMRRAGTAALWLVVIVGIVLGWTLGVPRLATYAGSNAPVRVGTQPVRYLSTISGDVDERGGDSTGSSGPDVGAARRVAVDPTPMTVTFRDLPGWMQGDELERLTCIVTECVGDDALDRDGLVRARERLLATGWFDSIAQVRRRELDQVEIVASFVTPAALVRTHDRDHLIDSNGRLLPRSWPSGQGPEIGVIVGVNAELPRHPGDAWPGADIAAALAVLEIVDRQPWASQVEAVDVAGFGADRSVRLLTNRGTTIRWGRAPGEERAAEVPVAMKLDYLMLHHRKYGHIDGGLVGEVDVSQDVAVVR
ncbi:MAG: cell division protein FtsQ/DivIB [Phycisphaerales bacterium]